MTADDAAGGPTQEEIDAFFARHAHEARRNPEKDFWWMQPLCPPTTLDALDAFRQLHQELRQWVADKGRRDMNNVKFWDAAEALRQGHVYGEPAPLAQIAWLTGPVNWPALLLGNERERLTHPERVKLTHLGLQNGRSGQER
jgi:hypothetical protein